MTTKFAPKLALIGSGQIGGTIALLSGLHSITNDIVMLDVVDGLPQGKALDLGQAFTAENKNVHVNATSDISATSEKLKDADVVIVTAGFPRKPGMSRNDLLSKNAEVIKGVGEAIKAQCPNAFVICLTNPLDVMVSVLQKASGLPPCRVVGMAGVLDSSRFRYFLGEALNVSPQDIHTMVLGGHGDDMVPLPEYTSIGGVPLKTMVETKQITEQKLQEIVDRTRNGGGEIVGLLKMGSAFVAPAAAAVQMVKAFLRDEKRLLPACAMLKGEYGLSDIYAGVPVIIGSKGVERVVELPLVPESKKLFDKSVDSVKETIEVCQSLGYNA